MRLARDLNESMPLYTEPQDLEVRDRRRARRRRSRCRRVGRPPAAPGAAAPPTSEPATAPATSRLGAPAIVAGDQAIRIEPRKRARGAQPGRRATGTCACRSRPASATVTVTFLNRTAALDETARLPFLRPYPAGVNIPETRLGAHLRSVEISGPYDATGAGRLAEPRSGIFACSRRRASDRDACARDDPVARWRAAPIAVRSTDADVAAAARVLPRRRAARRLRRRHRARRSGACSSARSSCSASSAIRRTRARAAPYRISDLELASRLSFFLWSSIPDDELLDAGGASGSSATPADARARRCGACWPTRAPTAFVQNFAGQWLFLRNLEATVPVQSVFPDFDDTPAAGIPARDRAVLRQHRARGPQRARPAARRLHVPQRAARAATTAIAERARAATSAASTLGADSPRARPARAGQHPDGHVVSRSHLAGRARQVDSREPARHAAAAAAAERAASSSRPAPTGAVLSMRERMAQHRANPVCASCHSMMDPLGLSLENFDAVGRWRTLGESATPIDAVGRAARRHEVRRARPACATALLQLGPVRRRR